MADVPDPAAAARAAGLRYVSDTMPGITRRRAGKAFAYHDPDGRLIKDRAELARIKRLADSASLDRCLDLSLFSRPSAGDRA